MAKTRDSLKSDIRTSIHGRRFGLSKDEFLAGPKGMLSPVSNATTSTTATNLTNHGTHTISSSTNGEWILDDPIAGCEVKIVNITASTNSVTFNNATVQTTAGIASSSATFNAFGEALILVGISTAQWACVSNNSAVVFSS